MTEIRQPYGSGLGSQPGIGKPDGWTPAGVEPQTPPPPDIDTAIDSLTPAKPDVGTAEWWETQRFDPFRSERIMAEDAVGSVGALPTFEWAMTRANPTNLTAQDPRFPLPIDQLGPIDIVARGEGGGGARLGALNADFLAPENTVEEIGHQLGQEGWGDRLEQFMRARDLDPLSFEFPSRIMDYGVAFPLAILGAPFGEENLFHDALKAMGDEGADDMWYAFQKSNDYWEWLESAGPGNSIVTETQIRDMAYQMAHAHTDGAAAVLSQRALEEQMQLDINKYLGISSGNHRYDWISKTALANTWGGADHWRADLSDAEQQEWSAGVVSKMFAYDPTLEDEFPREMVYEWVLKGSYSQRVFVPGEGWTGGKINDPESGTDWSPYSTGQDLVNSAAAMSATILPVVGTQIAEFIDPTDRFREAFWQSVDPDIRNKKQGDIVMGTMMTDMGVLIAGGVIIAPAVMGGAAAGASLPARAAYQGWTIGRNATKAALIWGVSNTTAHFALEFASPTYAATTGKIVDAARPVTDSPFAGVVNAAGILTTGSLGVIPTLQVGKHIAKKAARATQMGGRVNFTGEWEPAMVQVFFGGGGSRTTRMFANIGMDPTIQETAEMATMSSYMANHSLEGQMKLIFDSLNGVETGTALDRISAGAKLHYVERHLKNFDPQLAAEKGWTFLMKPQEPSLRVKLFDDVAMRDYKAAQKAWKSYDNEIAQKAVRDYAGFHGGSKAEIIGNVVSRLKRIQTNFPEAMAQDVDLVGEVTAVGGKLGDDVEELQRAANRAHSIEFHLESSEMIVAAEGSEEAARIHLIRQRTLTRDDITDELLATLRGNDEAAEAAKQELRATKDEVAKRLAGGDLTPEELAKFLEETKPTYAIKRVLPDANSPTAADPLNTYQRRLLADGEWDIGYIPYLDETLPGIGNNVMPVLPDGSINVGLKGEVQAITTPPDGYRKIVPGEEFRANREFIPTVSDGVYVKELTPNEIPVPTTNPGQFTNPAVNITIRHTPEVQVVDSYLTDLIKWDSPGSNTYFDANGYHYYPPPSNNADAVTPLLDDAGAEVVLHGNNYGASWPVLVDQDGAQWVFKAYRGPLSSAGGVDDLVNLSKGAIEAETRIGRFYSMVGLEGGAAIPYTYKRGAKSIEGTLQPYYSDISPIGPGTAPGTWMDNVAVADAWGGLSQTQREDVLGHWVMDWLFSQHDTNPGSLFIRGSDSKIIGVDKGQAFKQDQFMLGDWPPRLDYKPNAKHGQDTFSDFLDGLRSEGIELDRGMIEDVLQKLESIPDDIFDQQMLKIGMAREADTVLKQWKMPADEFAIEMSKRRKGMREAMNDLFIDELGGGNIPHPDAKVKLFKTGTPLSYQPSFGGPVFRNRNVDLQLLKDGTNAAQFAEPAPGNIKRAGVVIVEEDGSIWMAEPTNHFDGYRSQTVKGAMEDGENLREAAVREAYEETGFGVELEAHLIDYVDPDTGEAIRYYIGNRVSGGPRNVEKSLANGPYDMQPEVSYLINAQPQDHMSLVRAGAKQSGIDRDTAIIEAFQQHKSGGTLRNQVNDATAGQIGNAGDAVEALPGASPQTARRYVSYQRLSSGEYVRAPWVDQALTAPGPAALGKRTYIGKKLDEAFRGFRTWRIAETQRANLFRRLARDYRGIDDHQIEAFVFRLERIAEERHIPVQLVGNANAHALQSAPLIGGGIRKETVEAAEAVFGKNMVNRITGEVTPTAAVPWRDIIAKSHRQAFKHNLTAGFTSYIYSLPGGWAPALLGQGLWPTIKFSLSPIFKISEYAESAAINAGRGIRGKPADIAALYEPHMGFSRSMIAGEQGLSPYLSGMGGYGRVGDHVTMTGKGSEFTQLGTQAKTAEHISAGRLVTWEDALTTEPFVADVSQDGVTTFLHSPSTTSSGTVWPSSLPDYTPQAMLPRRLGPDGKTWVNYSPEEWDALRLADQQAHPLSWERYLQTDADIDQALWGLAVLRELGYERIDRLIDSMPIFHNPGGDWLMKLDFADPQFVHGPRGTRMDSGAVFATGQTEGTIDWGGSIGNMGDDGGVQMLTLQGGQAKYATFGRSDISISRGDVSIVYNHSVIKRALITDSDRIGTGFNYGDSAMTAQGMLTNTRYQLLKNISNMRPGDKIEDALKSGAYHNELAIYEAPSWAEVDALVFETQTAMDDFLRQVENASAEVKEAVKHVETRLVKKSNGYSDWGGTADDMMWEKSGIAELRDVQPILPRDESLIGLIDPANVPVTQGEAMMNAVRSRARIAGYEVNQAPQTGYGLPSIMNNLNKTIDDIAQDVGKAQEGAVRHSLTMGEAGDSQAILFERQAQLDEARGLWQRIDEWRQSGNATYTTQKEARRGQMAVLNATDDSMGNTEAFAETHRAWENGDITRQEAVDWVGRSPDLNMTPEQRTALAKALDDELQIEEFTDAFRVIKYGESGSLPTNAHVDTWEIFGAKGSITNQATKEHIPFQSDPIALGPTGHWEQRRNYADAVAVERTMGEKLPPAHQMQNRQTAFPATGDFRGEFVTAEFVDRLHKRAIEARNGVDPGSPIVNVFVRGTAKGIKDGPREGAVEIVMVVRSADNETLGIGLKEIEDIWMETGLPKNHIGKHPSLGQIGWDDTTREVLIGGDMDLLRHTLPDGTIQIDGGGVPGARVVFTDSFESGGQAYKSLVGFDDGYFDPQLISTSSRTSRTIDDTPVTTHTRRYEGKDNSWEWSYNKDQNTIRSNTSQEGRIQKDAAEDARLRDIFAFARGEGADRSWRVEVNALGEMDGALKRAWYLGEIPDNVVLVDVGDGTIHASAGMQTTLDDAYFQQKWGARQDIKNLHPPRGVEDVPGTAEYVQRSMNDEIALRLGVDPADIAAGDINALLAKVPENIKKREPGLIAFVKNIMDPIPMKERLMNRQIMQEVNGIFVGVMKTSNDPAYGYFKKLGVPDEDITEFLLMDRDLVDKWLTTGRQSDFDAIIAHTEKYTKKTIGAEERQLLDDLYSSSDYQTLQQMWRMSLKGAQDEAFGAHFFNPYRSWFERSLNHPVFGIYPLSWSLKAAREWARFLFDNSLLAGGKMKIGMTPAVLINEYNRKIDTLVAQNGGSVHEMLSINGPIGNMMMTAGLIMPGDWSSIPFPFSRTIRDVIRGNVSTDSMLEDNMVGGFIRDARLAQGSLQEARDLVKPFVPEGTPLFYQPDQPKPTRIGPTTYGRDIKYIPRE